MNNTALRLWIVVALVVAAYGVSFLVKAGTTPPEVQLPGWTFSELPTELPTEVSSPQGTIWRGEDAEMDPKVTVAIGADSGVDRMYRDEKGNTVSMHTAIFKNPAEGVLHSPVNCYRGAGWEKLTEETSAEIQVNDKRSVPVNITTWERGGERVVVLYWYQIGEHVVFSRFDLGEVRWAMRGRPAWPATVKVLLQTSAEGDLDDAKNRILDLAEQIGRWINKPSHQTDVGETPET